MKGGSVSENDFVIDAATWLWQLMVLQRQGRKNYEPTSSS